MGEMQVKFTFTSNNTIINKVSIIIHNLKQQPDKNLLDLVCIPGILQLENNKNNAQITKNKIQLN